MRARSVEDSGAVVCLPDATTVRIDDARTDRRYESDFLECDVEKLKAIFAVGRESFAAREGEDRTLFQKVEY